MKLFTLKKSQTKEENEQRIQLIRNIYSALWLNPSMSEESRQKILIGSLVYTHLSAKEIQEDVASQYKRK
ncbi:hypothetical protein Lqui_2949 [Legionella quinlivanii]|uniref:Uncharacterized protein n=1 Tax=Legionella quinlivanii TaxID=45073 RepID=A0A0W0XLK6_9GAMM|nr:hypothetical protein [Legionella quinlivanii]KTD45478.1 hypothetical protein Lqui_2949 [Legionella quinlivanii]MCW8451234.1 hypothetical protein [Legionella quinlivanii]SEG32690.1 hypothetical protein SAMN02746093_02536 [Legionella quinlivanii DSM 21216]STY10570.1 Uncharacterised protein [Legionella quinlivanii]